MIWYYVFDNMFWTPSLPNFCHKKHFFSIFWHGVTSPPPISTMSTNILFFFWGYPLVGVSNLPLNQLTWKHSFMEPLGMTLFIFTLLLLLLFFRSSVLFLHSILELLHHPGSVIYFKIIDGFWHSRCLNDQIHLFYMIESFAKSFIKSWNSDSKYNFEIFKN